MIAPVERTIDSQLSFFLIKLTCEVFILALANSSIDFQVK